MTVWPTVDSASLLLPTLPGHDDALWDTLIELTELRTGEWTLIGGQMVYLYAIEHAATPPFRTAVETRWGLSPTVALGRGSRTTLRAAIGTPTRNTRNMGSSPSIVNQEQGRN
jgi:hypothetical protein